MKSFLASFLIIAILCVNVLSEEKQKVVCTIPSLTAIAKEVGGDDFEYITLAKPDQDPHYVSPTPLLMKKTNEAELLIEVGMQLEIWADNVANNSGNPKIFRGGKGRIVASLNIPKEEVPSIVTRAEGHIHPEGNPHIWLDPIRTKMIAENIAQALITISPYKKDKINERLKDFQNKIDKSLFGEELIKLVGSQKLTRLALDGTLFNFLSEKEYKGEKLITKLGGWLKKAEQLRGMKVVEYHKVWVYFCKVFGMDIIGTVEEKPGISPGPRHIREITEKIKNNAVKIILVDNFYNPSLPNLIAKETGSKVVVLPNQVGGEQGIDDYFDLIEYLLDKILEAMK